MTPPTLKVRALFELSRALYDLSAVAIEWLRWRETRLLSVSVSLADCISMFGRTCLVGRWIPSLLANFWTSCVNWMTSWPLYDGKTSDKWRWRVNTFNDLHPRVKVLNNLNTQPHLGPLSHACFVICHFNGDHTHPILDFLCCLLQLTNLHFGNSPWPLFMWSEKKWM